MGPNSHIVYQSGLHRVSCKKNHCRNPRPLTYYTHPKTLLLRRTGKERPFPHSERIRERPLPIKMMNGKENAVQFFVNERERSGAQFFREHIRPCPFCPNTQFVDNLFVSHPVCSTPFLSHTLFVPHPFGRHSFCPALFCTGGTKRVWDKKCVDKLGAGTKRVSTNWVLGQKGC